MKIGIISNLYPPFIRGGAEVIAAAEAEGLKKAWQHVFVISSRPKNIRVRGGRLMGSKSITQDEINEVSVFRFNPINIYYYLNDFKYPGFVRLLWHLFDMFNIFSYFSVKKILKEEKPDLVITHNLMGLGFLIPRLLRQLKIKHIHTIHDVQLVTPSGLIIKDKEQAWQHKLFTFIGYVKVMRWLMGSPEIIISPSKFLLNYYKQSNFFAKSKKVYLPNPVKGAIDIKKESSQNLELLYLGQVHKAKGVLDLVKHFEKIKLPHIRLHVVGVGQDMSKAKKLAKDDKRIHFHGWMQHSSLMPLLSKMDTLIVPSMCYENSPAVIYEALSMGLPVMAADIGGVPELIIEGKNGWIFTAGNFDELNKKIISLYKQRDKIKLMSENCRRSVAKYNIDNYTEKILELANETK
ncbi:glycosyltransferase [Candidatus Parcubacteria bacterium]|jgi:glycosyltransferase involved in cell wall biosynthesis|nr:glycosyltransferase [Candidatus Parcubacteria bacterium]